LQIANILSWIWKAPLGRRQGVTVKAINHHPVGNETIPIEIDPIPIGYNLKHPFFIVKLQSSSILNNLIKLAES
jgi:hypothetical protein